MQQAVTAAPELEPMLPEEPQASGPVTQAVQAGRVHLDPLAAAARQVRTEMEERAAPAAEATVWQQEGEATAAELREVLLPVPIVAPGATIRWGQVAVPARPVVTAIQARMAVAAAAVQFLAPGATGEPAQNSTLRMDQAARAAVLLITIKMVGLALSMEAVAAQHFPAARRKAVARGSLS